MSSVQKKFLVGGIVMVLAVGYLGFAGVRSGWVYFMEVDKFALDSSLHRQRVRLCGTASTEGFVVSAGALKADFTLQGKTQALKVSYKGVIPDMFQAGRDVVVEGKLDNAGVFQADVLMTKCASKYEAGKAHPTDIPLSETK